MTGTPDLHPDTAALRVLAHPVRLRLLGLLRTEGPSTASRLAERLALNSGATSYHLRKLEAGGLIVEDAGRGSGRDRWWRSAHRSTRFDFEDEGPEEREAGTAYLREVAAIYGERMRRAAEEVGYLPGEWRAGGTFSDAQLQLTSRELGELTDELEKIVDRRPRLAPGEEPPEGTAPVVVQVQSFVRPGWFGG